MMPSSPPSAHPAPPPRHRRAWRIARALAIVAGLDALGWLVAQQGLDRAVSRWTMHLRAQGWAVRMGPAQRGGSPLTARILLRNPRLDARFDGHAAAWGADAMTLSLSLLHPLTMRVGFRGAQALRLDGPGPDAALALRIDGTDARIALPLAMPADAPAGRADWAATRLTIQILRPDGGIATLALHAPHGRGLWNDQAGPQASRLALTARSDAIDLPPNWLPTWLSTPPLALAPTPPLAPALATAAGDARRLADAGLTLSVPGGAGTATDTTLLVQDIHGRWMGLSLALAGRMHPFAAGGPDGTFTLSATGIGQGIHTLERAGMLSPDLARAVAAIDRLAAGRPTDDPPPTDRRLDLPLRLRAGALFVGSLNVTGLPAIIRPAAPRN